MKLTERHPYDATPAAVWAMITDPAFRAEVCEATGAETYDVDIDTDDDGGSVSITRALPAPTAVRKLVGDTVTIVQTETWGAADGGGARRADVRLKVEGQPASLTGTSAITPTSSGSAFVVEGDLRVKIPLLGGKLEKDLASAVSAGLAAEHEVGRRYLS